MSRALFLSVLALVVGILCLSGSRVNAQDCERVIPGNAQSPCKQLDYLDGIQPPTFLVEQFTDNQGEYACQGFLEFKSSTSLQEHSDIFILGNESDVPIADIYDSSWNGPPDGFNGLWHWGDNHTFLADEDSVRYKIGRAAHLTSTVDQNARVSPFLIVGARFLYENSEYGVVSLIFQRPEEVADYQLQMNQCLAGITRQLEHDAASEAARRQAEEDRIRAETAAEEAKNKAELAAIELRSAQDALKAQEELNTSLLQETILSIKREDAIRAAWQQVILVRMAGLEERTAIWNEAVNRWAEEDLQFSVAMEARIQEVERLQTLNAALERSMASQRKLLIAKLEELEKAEQEALENRTPSDSPTN